MSRWQINPHSLSDRRPELDGIRALGIVMVICIHAAGQYTHVVRTVNAGWWSALVLDCLSRTCVPWFVMISGGLLLGGRTRLGIGSFYRRRMSRLLIPFAFWVAVYLGWRWLAHGDVMGLRRLAVEVLSGPVYFHLWYLYLIVGLFAAAPFLDRMLDALGAREALWFVGVWFGGASLLPYVEWVLGGKTGVPLGWFSSYFGLLVAGAVCRGYRIPAELRRGAAVGLAFLWAGTTAVSAVLSWRDQALNETALAYLAPNVVLLAVGGFLWLRDCDWSWLEGQTAFARLTRYVGCRSLPIYLAHVLILELLSPQVFALTANVSLLAPPALAVAVLIATLGVVRIGESVPGLRLAFA